MRLHLLLAVLLAAAGCATPSTAREHKHFVLVGGSDYQPLLKGPPETGGMRSGHVILKPGAQMHRHSTEANEEMLVFLQGQGEVALSGTKVVVKAGEAFYIPPQTEHEVLSLGPGDLAYVYIVAPTR
jgi:mannose-6-phosphate isomerase-like protein (cupin superfamily)